MAWRKSSKCDSGSCIEVDFRQSSKCDTGACVQIGYKRSSKCENGQCLEVGFQKSTYCSDGTCVEVATCHCHENQVLVRDSKQVNLVGEAGPYDVLRFSAGDWRQFLADVPVRSRG